MKRIWFCILVLTLSVTPILVFAQQPYEFKLGFKLLAEQIPAVAGQPVEEEHYGDNGDSLQQTTTGLMVWRKADNWTAFTNGSRTWVNGPFGVMERSNEERFDWEASDSNQRGRQGPQPTPIPRSSPDDATRSTRSGYPRVNVRPGAEWAKAAIFWFGRATEHDNYVDSRVYYDDRALYVYLAVTDYYLWTDQSGSGDPRQSDAAALYLDTGAVSEGPYLFVSGFRSYPVENDVRWHRQARLSPAGWDYSIAFSPDWKDLIGLRYYNSGPNNNSDRDGGWTTTFTIPWAAIGFESAPPAGTSWGMALRVYDRDEPAPAGGPAETYWTRAFSEGNPASWGSLVFDPSQFAPSGQEAGTTVIRRGLDNARVQDAYAGGGGNCQGGVFGDGDRPHPTSELFVQNQSDIADFPCFSKSFLNFDLGGIPAGKKIVSATLTLHSFGGSDPGQAKSSQIQLLAVDDEWDEATLTWNNAPMARENVSVATVDVLKSFPGWPGVPFSWDATQAVAEAYAAGKNANIALYSTDSAYHSGKYFVSSDTGDWNAVARPTLTVKWAD